MKKNRKGFTLVELTIVLSITAVVVMMVCTFMAIYNTNTYKLEGKSDELRDLTNIQSQINNWVNHYDSSYCTVSIVNSGAGLSAARSTVAETNTEITITPSTLTFADGVLTDSGYQNTTGTYNNIATVVFAYAKENSVADDGTVTELTTDNTRLIVCTVTTDSGKTQKFMFARQSQTTRNRYSSGNRLDIAKIENATKAFIDENSGATFSVSSGAVSANGQTLAYQVVNESKRLSWKTGLISKKYYGLVSATGITYAIETVDGNNKLVATITFSDGTETLEWAI